MVIKRNPGSVANAILTKPDLNMGFNLELVIGSKLSRDQSRFVEMFCGMIQTGIKLGIKITSNMPQCKRFCLD